MHWSRKSTWAWLLGLLVLAFTIYDLHKKYSPLEWGAENLIVLTVATMETSALYRLQRSARVNQLPLKVLGLGQRWKGFGQKVHLLRRELQNYRDDPNTIVLFVDGYDVLFNGGKSQILERFRRLQARILFSAEGTCWPNESLAPAHPQVKTGKRFLNSGLFMGYSKELLALLSHSGIPDTGNDQLYYTELYINHEIRTELGFKLDHRSEIFQSFFRAINDTELRFQNNKAVIYNRAYDTWPVVLHANGPSEDFLNTVENYIPQAWNPIDGCLACLEQTISLAQMAQYPTVLIGVFVRNNTLPLARFFDALFNLVYPKNRIDLSINVPESIFKDLDVSVHDRLKLYRDVKLSREKWEGFKTTRRTITECITRKNDYFFSLDSTVLLNNRDTLKLLIEQNRTAVAPMLFKKSNLLQANFLVTFEPQFNPPSMDILSNDRRGLWKVAEVHRSYLVREDVLARLDTKLNAKSASEDSDGAFCRTMRENDVNIYVSNRFNFGTYL